MTERYDVAVVGLGLFGSAALRHLARRGLSVVGIGPGEPADPSQHDGVFASHHDSGRITRRIDADDVWAELADRAIAQYGEIAAQSGIEFHRPAGLLWVDGDCQRTAAMEDVVAERRLDVTVATFAKTAPSWPFLDFPGSQWSLHEGPPAGHIDPRKLKAAQLESARRSGAAVMQSEVIGHVAKGDHHRLRVSGDFVVEADRLLVAAGAYSRDHSALPVAVPLRIKSETIVLGEVDATEVERLATMPSVIYGLDHPVVSDVYVVPPVRYPDGRWYVKIGANTVADQDLESVAAINAWMRSGDTDVQAGGLQEVLRAMLPGTTWESFMPKRCLISYTPHGRPYVDDLGGRIFIAAGGNGMGAKSSDAIGGLAADLVATGEWRDPLPASLFAVPEGS